MRPHTYLHAGAALLLLTFAACGSNDPSPARAAPVPAPTVTSTSIPGSAPWTTVSEKKACEPLSPQFCRGYYGFSVFADGHYEVGPGPDGQVLSGKISESELQQIDGDIQSFTTEELQADVTCRSDRPALGIEDDIHLVHSSGNYLVYSYAPFGNGGKADCYSGNAQKADRLHQDLGTLLDKYYPAQFPGAPQPSGSPSASPSPSPTFTVLGS